MEGVESSQIMELTESKLMLKGPLELGEGEEEAYVLINYKNLHN